MTRKSGKDWARESAPTPEQEAAERVASVRAKENVEREKRIGHVLRKQIEELEASLRVALDLSRPLPPVDVRGVPSRGTKQACAIIAASDWHVEEVVDPGHVNGLNEYGPEIARKRAERFVEGVLWLLDTHRSGARIDHAVLCAIGDFITGFIHEELQHSNALLPTEAVLLAQELLHSVIVTLLRRGRLKTLHVVCSRGNHGRTTKRTFINAAARTSYEWLMFRALAQRFDGDRRVTFTVEDGYYTYFSVFDKTIRASHGDAVSYQGGVGGLTIPLRKAIARANKARRADLDVIGHFHQLLYGGDFIVNGSLIGWNDYATWIGASPEPAQQAFALIRPERGVSAFAPIFVT